MAFDPRDIYDAAALYDMWLNCQSCPKTFDFEPNRPIGLDYYHDIGQQAKHDGWVVAEQVDVERPDEESYMVLCSHCAAQYGLTAGNARTAAAPAAIEEVCQAMAMAEQGQFAA
ncbi:MAG: hypothetical protein KBT87_08895 [Gammaproteobacteria bacterium]|jgi:hypothetical protein|nr:hypothetical protein [Gammaproteobacteria bacterium]MBQ0774775.1 hypothetical protein [Gammaproteobacteria bacterium]|tara:strand:- start:47675 stop:48016 length:342 start_codon:yes stop_codon:yes gene_type:complete